MITVKEAAKEFKISERTIREMIRQRTIPFFRVGARSVRFDRTELREKLHIDSRTKKSPGLKES